MLFRSGQSGGKGADGGSVGGSTNGGYGGSAGYAVNGNSKIVWLATGTRIGSIA